MPRFDHRKLWIMEISLQDQPVLAVDGFSRDLVKPIFHDFLEMLKYVHEFSQDENCSDLVNILF